METWMSIIIEVSFALLIGVLYYTIQKKRIIKHDTIEVFSKLEHLIYELNSYLDDKKNEHFYTELNELTLKLESILKKESLDILLLEFHINEKVFPKELSDLAKQISDHLEFYRKSSGNSN